VSTWGGSLLVVDVGTSGVRSAVVRPDATVAAVHHRPVLPDAPAPGLVEGDAAAWAEAGLATAAAALAEAGPVAGVGVANQRATTVVWERASGRPVFPALGWQDLRTVVTCLELKAEGIRLAPNQSATKLAAVLDAVDPSRARAEAGELLFGTVDSWMAWVLQGGSAGGARHVTDATNAAVTGLVTGADGVWDDALLARLRIPPVLLPEIVDTTGELGPATALPGAPPLCALVGDQQASLVGQGCLTPGLAKATFGTGGMLDLCTGSERPDHAGRNPGGTFPIVAWQRAGVATFGVEAVMLSAGTAVEWLVQDLGVLDQPSSSAAVAAGCPDTGDVWFVPALLGLGTPVWDFGARGTLLGVTRGTGRAEVVRAVLEGVAQRGADLLEAAEADSGARPPTLRVDGGMSGNEIFVTALAEACGRPVEVSTVTEATTLGAGLLAGLATGTWSDEEEVAAAYAPAEVVEPSGDEAARAGARARWLEARGRAEGTVPELSGIDF
jgi:glycerol kinase